MRCVFDRLGDVLRAGLLVALSFSGTAAQPRPAADELPVLVENRSEPEVCAEKDNIFVPMTSGAVTRFQIQAVQPAYIGAIAEDRFAPDFTACDMSGDPAFVAGAPRKVTLYEDPELWVVGYTFPAFWRPATVPVRIGDRVENGLHIIQVWLRVNERAEEVLVVYPPDGYWRARPLPPKRLGWTAYGSSFLVGPVEMAGRPIVAYKEIVFDPKSRTFTLPFARGGQASMAMKTLDIDRMVLDVRLDKPIEGMPFAALRSMHITDTNNDVARIAWREKNKSRWGETHILDFKDMQATEIWAGRHGFSRHNTSAPDMVFSRFGN